MGTEESRSHLLQMPRCFSSSKSIPFGCRNDSHIHLYGTMISHSLILFGLEGPQKLDLNGKGHISDLIQEDKTLPLRPGDLASTVIRVTSSSRQPGILHNHPKTSRSSTRCAGPGVAPEPSSPLWESCRGKSPAHPNHSPSTPGHSKWESLLLYLSSNRSRVPEIYVNFKIRRFWAAIDGGNYANRSQSDVDVLSSRPNSSK